MKIKFPAVNITKMF